MCAASSVRNSQKATGIIVDSNDDLFYGGDVVFVDDGVIPEPEAGRFICYCNESHTLAYVLPLVSTIPALVQVRHLIPTEHLDEYIGSSNYLKIRFRKFLPDDYNWSSSNYSEV